MPRTEWNDRYRARKPIDFDWYTAAPPVELVRLLEAGVPALGTALDLGCGPGSITCYLCRRFATVIGIDIAETAIHHARDLARHNGVTPHLVVGDALRLPFPPQCLDFVFDRGCLHALRRSARPVYFTEVERVLKSGGVFQLFCRTGGGLSVLQHLFGGSGDLPRPPSLPGFHKRLRRYRGQKRHMSAARLGESLPRSFEVLTFEEFPYELKQGRTVHLAHAVCRKR